MPESTEKKSYKDTLNLPKTAFAMKANLVQNEPATLKRWNEAKLYDQIRHARAGSPRFAFHDGPPYANGSIHLGHLLNKVLKDFVVRSHTMAGQDVPYVPGWDCHGLPIEHKVMQDLAEKAHTMEPFQVRRKCRESAEKFIKLQKGQMQRLLTVADYDHPYMTMDPAYEAGVLEVFADLVGKGLVYWALKPVHWSIENRTALAEAELEYYDRKDTSVYVLFEVERPSGQALKFVDFTVPNDTPVYLMIWTTTPWTLPANRAVAAGIKYDYSLVRLPDGKLAIIATDLIPKVEALCNSGKFERLKSGTGYQMLEYHYRHPFIEASYPVVFADYVTLEDGTGLVHTAPGHGVEDYQTGLREGLPIYCPVQADGTFDDTAPTWLRGQTVWKGNHLVVEHLRQSGHLFHEHEFTHSYPHDWRGKTPTIFRATEQWFIGVDKPLSPRERVAASSPSGEGSSDLTLRSLALSVTDSQVQFIPEWGRNRMRGMLESRPDWCISRQRSWGLPIPAFYVEGESVLSDQIGYLLTAASVRAVAAKIREHGSDFWFKTAPADLLTDYDVAADPQAPQWLKDLAKVHSPDHRSRLAKSSDIFDVWFESGSSWYAVMHQRQLTRPDGQVDLYLEGSDQHRGWFQCSLLPGLGFMGQSPFRTVLTHGFMVDKDGRKMSKSLGNALEVDTLLKEHGADVCRWWVSSINTDNDIKVDPQFFKLAGEEYRKIRNTIRFLLSNLFDFNVQKDAYSFTESDAASVDAWARNQVVELVAAVTKAYADLNFRLVQENLFNFCNQTLSAVYMDAVKDRLYCDKADSPRRRRTQTVMHETASAMIRLMAPILPHTADEAWRALCGESAGSVHLELMPRKEDFANLHSDERWSEVITTALPVWLKRIEDERNRLAVDNPMDLGLVAPVDEKIASFLRRIDLIDIADLCGVSRVTLKAVPATSASSPGADLAVEVLDLRAEPRCERSWKRDGTVKPRSDGGMLSDRDASALGLA